MARRGQRMDSRRGEECVAKAHPLRPVAALLLIVPPVAKGNSFFVGDGSWFFGIHSLWKILFPHPKVAFFTLEHLTILNGWSCASIQPFQL